MCFSDWTCHIVVFVVVVIVNVSHYCLPLQSHLAILTKLGTKHPCVSRNESPRRFPKEDNTKISNKYLLRTDTTGPISTKLGTKHSLLKGIQFFFSYKGFRPFPKGKHIEIAKIHWRNLKIVFSRTIGLFSTKLPTKHIKDYLIPKNELMIFFCQSMLWYSQSFAQMCFSGSDMPGAYCLVDINDRRWC